MKRLIALLLAVFLVAGNITAPALAEDTDSSAEALKDGTYTGIAVCDPSNGSSYDPEDPDFTEYYLKVTITVENGEVTGITEIAECDAEGNKTGNTSNSLYISIAAGSLKTQILNKGGTEGVDAVTNATCSSYAIIAAYNDAIAQAKAAALEDVAKIYGTIAMTYYEFYQNEVSSDIAKDEAGYYDAVTSATTGSHTGDIATIHNWYSDEESGNLVINGLKTVDIYMTPEVLAGLTDSEDLEEIKAALAQEGITLTSYEDADGTLYDANGAEDEDQKLDIASVKALNSDGSYGASETVTNSNVSDITEYVAGSNATGTVIYSSSYGDLEVDINYSGTEGATGMGISLANDSDKSIWSAYKNNIYSVTLKNEDTGKIYGAVWYEDIWSESSHGSYLQIAINREDRTVKNNPITAGRYADLSAGTYTATVKSRGYEDVVVSDIEIGEILETKPSLTKSTYSTADEELVLMLDTTDVASGYIAALPNAEYSLKQGSTVVEAELTKSADGKTITIVNNGLAPGSYTLTGEVTGYQSVSYSFTLISDQEQLSLKVGETIYSPGEQVSVTAGEPIYLVDADGNFVEGYGNSATIAVNGTTISNRGSDAVTVLVYDAANKVAYFDTGVSTFAEGGEFAVMVTITGFETYTYTFTVTIDDETDETAETTETEETTATEETTETEETTATDETDETDAVVTIITFGHESTGITLQAEASVIGAADELSINEIVSGDDYTLAAKALKDISTKFKLYDMALVDEDGNVVQPEGEVVVSIPIPDDYDINKLAVYYIASDGTIAQMSGYVSGENYIFTTDHFSLYALVEKNVSSTETSSTASTSTKSSTSTTSSGSSVKTGDESPVVLWIILLGLSFTVVGSVILLKRSGKAK